MDQNLYPFHKLNQKQQGTFNKVGEQHNSWKKKDETAPSKPQGLKSTVLIDPFFEPRVLRKNSVIQKFIPPKDIVSKVLVLFTGGTIGMLQTRNGVYAPQPNYLERNIRKFPELHDQEYIKRNYPEKDKVPLVLPETRDNRRVIYTIYEYDPLLDSANMTMDDWRAIALGIKQYYDTFDGFVILHGTDTLAYTASALSFMLENLGKTVILTGSQIPLYEPRSDGRENFLNSLIIAGNYCIPEVSILFSNHLYRGNRTSKVNSNSFKAFKSPNMMPLVTVGININIHWQNVFKPKQIDKFHVHDTLNPHVGLLRLFPSITMEVVRAFLMPPIEGVVLQTYGVGNGPTNRKDLLDELRQATRRGVIIVNCTQCNSGLVDPAYETGSALLEVGAVLGSDMTPEAALTKLSYVLSKSEWSLQTKIKMMESNLRGELTVVKHARLEDKDLITGVINAMHLSSAEEIEGLRSAVYPSILCSVTAKGDLEKLEIMRQFGAYLSACDYDFRTPLHVAASEGNVETVKYLLQHGANIHMRDREHKCPMQTAIEFDHHPVIELLKNAGSQLCIHPFALADTLISAVKKNSVQRLKSLALAGANLNEHDGCRRTALHVAVEMDHEDCVKYLLEAGIQTECADIYEHTPLDIANILKRHKIKELLEQHLKDGYRKR
ncbi:L-asparaginase-like [Limulus polyphemus]|uniref:asparaginase n=1 Tax=Limulus polyphemus TaxID=6850 RepID=A0ABM1SDC5_LIMPO|nr:L-asparaginase-like [Limulus polyphemus]XP_022241630.1 L-asparaginase-like [Limulus polyphemus]